MKSSTRSVVFALPTAIALAASALCQSAKEIPAEPPEHLKSLSAGNRLPPINLDDGHRIFFARGVDAKARQSIGGSVTAMEFSRQPDRGITVDCPPDLAVGDVVPIFGYLYRVNAEGSRGVSFRWVGKDLPPGISLQPGSLGVPLSEKRLGYHIGQAVVDNTRLLVVGIERSDNAKNDSFVAEVRVSRFSPPGEATTFRVRAGDVLTIGEARHKVRNVVPRDPKNHVIGWVELDPKPLERASAKTK